MYTGRWNPACGHDQLVGTWLVIDQSVVAAISTQPTAFLRGTISSATAVTLTDWATNLSFSDSQPLSGTMQLGNGAFVISPTAPPFSIEMCNFEQYSGVFAGVQGGGAVSRPNGATSGSPLDLDEGPVRAGARS
ncbi:MAG: hypothetical protein ACE5I7_02730 [Candidatus Binatia bacterium]